MSKRDFQCSDLWLASFLWNAGLTPNLETIGDKVIFTFPHSAELDKLLVDYQNNCPVNVIDYVSRAKTLRGQLMDKKAAMRQGASHE